MSTKQQCLKKFKSIRMHRKLEDKLSIKELVRRSVIDGNRSFAPVREIREEKRLASSVVQGMRDLTKAAAVADEMLIPQYSQSMEDVGRGEGAWLPQDFSQDAKRAIEECFGYKNFEKIEIPYALIDSSFHQDVNNESLAGLGSSLLHLLTRSCGWEQFTSLEASLELATNEVISKVFRSTKASRYVLTSLDVATQLDSHCFYGTSLGKNVVSNYPTDADLSHSTTRSVKIRTYSTCMKAILAAVYLEHGLDQAHAFFNEHMVPKIQLVVQGKIR
eukprot:TRINITY_DN21791_c0_g1_i1.p1 TRINITY_DN21791_c0_g1~~TRINITY_DN21791_c0_g1_i1.p1  ORF type:complete len:289 (+),score=66.70 TRINITY_DN21791_c0_g1_i1:43-867(+)